MSTLSAQTAQAASASSSAVSRSPLVRAADFSRRHCVTLGQPFTVSCTSGEGRTFAHPDNVRRQRSTSPAGVNPRFHVLAPQSGADGFAAARLYFLPPRKGASAPGCWFRTGWTGRSAGCSFLPVCRQPFSGPRLADRWCGWPHSVAMTATPAPASTSARITASARVIPSPAPHQQPAHAEP
ncbi:Uncharacterised protein [Klebsiella pneumoniae]|uniref:Uncharacterized protein n=1 Tax=Klebsiella pneumoniae TaxID=573 RepID=A0A377U2N8_KLEPN|nr:Uncharacterised protein [Klebsiella pneumoniae]